MTQGPYRRFTGLLLLAVMTVAGCYVSDSRPPIDRSLFRATLLPPGGAISDQAHPVGNHIVQARLTQPTHLPATAELTLEQLVNLTATENPELAAARARAGAARGRLIQEGLYPNPTVGWVGSQILHQRNAAGEEGPLVTQVIVTGNKLQLAQEAAAHGVAAADWQAITKWFEVVTRVRLAYFEVLTAEAEVKANEVVEALATKGYTAAETLRKGGAGTLPDVLQSTVEVNQAKLRLDVSRQRLDTSWKLLRVAVGVPDLPRQPLAGSLHAPMPQYEWEPVRTTMLARSSEVHDAVAAHRQAEAGLHRARAEVVPNVTVGIRPFYSFPDQDKRLFIDVGMPIPVFNRNQGNIHAAEADVMRTHQEVRQVELKLEERLAGAFQRYRSAWEQVDAYTKRILPDANKSLDLVRLAYERGDAKYDYAALLQAQRTVAQAELARVQALGELWRAATEIAGLAQD